VIFSFGKSFMRRQSLTFLLSLLFVVLGQCGDGASPSAVVQAATSRGSLSDVAYDFENGSVAGWENGDSDWVLQVMDALNTGKCLRVDYRKTHAWNFISMNIDSEQLVLHRFITMKVKGRVRLLGKLWCSEEIQQDMGTQTAFSDSKWTMLRFDTRKADRIAPGQDKVEKLLLFVEPGAREGRGAFYIDDVKYSGK
jgi:hypothetical protein